MWNILDMLTATDMVVVWKIKVMDDEFNIVSVC